VLWFGLEGECELMIGCARSVKTFTRTAEGANEYGLDIVLLATSEFSIWLNYSFLTRSLLAQMLQAVHVIHEEKIVHSDLKPANFVLVRGQLKLIDFGIANAIANDTTNIQRDHQVRCGSVLLWCVFNADIFFGWL
jgi:Protein kinase domain